MSQCSTDDFGKKFQLTDSLLRRILNQDEYECIKVVEPVIVVTDDASTKQLKNPVYKHAAVSCKFLYVVNTPARHESDVIYTIPLDNVKDVASIHDVADFLQGELQKQAQHIRLTCKHQIFNVTESLCIQAESLSLISLNNNTSNDSIQQIQSKPLKDYLPLSSSRIVHQPKVAIDHRPNIKTGTSMKPPSGKTNAKSRSSSISSQVLPSKRSSTRPLPRPLSGTETLNASYTSSMLLEVKNGIANKSIPPRCLSPSKSYNDIAKHAKESHPLSSSNLNSSFPSTRLGSSLNGHLSKSWNDIMKAEQTSQEKIKKIEKRYSNSSTESNGDLSSSLGQSFSSKLFKLFKGSQDSVFDGPSSSTGVLKGASPVTSRTSSVSSQNEDCGKLDYVVDLFTMSKISNLFNILKEAWINALIDGTLSLENKRASLQKSPLVPRRASMKMESDVVTQKFTHLKEEIESCHQYDQLFLLTKEMKFACEKYLFIKKMAWKSGKLFRVYLNMTKRLLRSKTDDISDRMDEIDTLIIIYEFLICLYHGTELCSSRNFFLNENRASSVKELLGYILRKPTFRNSIKEKEVDELLDSHLNISVLLLYEIINAANMSNWNCTLEQKSFNVPFMVELFRKKETEMTQLMDHVMTRLTSQLSNTREQVASPKDVSEMYKYLVIIHFVCVNCPNISQNIKTYYQEEIKYYMSKKENIDALPKAYPLVYLLSAFIPNVMQLLTQQNTH